MKFFSHLPCKFECIFILCVFQTERNSSSREKKVQRPASAAPRLDSVHRPENSVNSRIQRSPLAASASQSQQPFSASSASVVGSLSPNHQTTMSAEVAQRLMTPTFSSALKQHPYAVDADGGGLSALVGDHSSRPTIIPAPSTQLSHFQHWRQPQQPVQSGAAAHHRKQHHQKPSTSESHHTVTVAPLTPQTEARLCAPTISSANKVHSPIADHGSRSSSVTRSGSNGHSRSASKSARDRAGGGSAASTPVAQNSSRRSQSARSARPSSTTDGSASFDANQSISMDEVIADNQRASSLSQSSSLQSLPQHATNASSLLNQSSSTSSAHLPAAVSAQSLNIDQLTATFAASLSSLDGQQRASFDAYLRQQTAAAAAAALIAMTKKQQHHQSADVVIDKPRRKKSDGTKKSKKKTSAVVSTSSISEVTVANATFDSAAPPSSSSLTINRSEPALAAISSSVSVPPLLPYEPPVHLPLGGGLSQLPAAFSLPSSLFNGDGLNSSFLSWQTVSSTTSSPRRSASSERANRSRSRSRSGSASASSAKQRPSSSTVAKKTIKSSTSANVWK